MGIITIKKNREFRQVFARGRYSSDRLLVVYRAANGSGRRRFGVTVSRKLGGAVVRNRVRRRLKEICRLNQEVFPSGYDYVIVARPPAAECDHQVLAGSLLKLVGSLK
jgi:ribonuclease P protein component